MSTCDKYLYLIQKHISGELSADESRALSGHLEKCGTCRLEAQLLRGANALLCAAGAPRVDGAEWAERARALEERTSGVDALPADLVRPPDVSREEWESVWQDIERQAVLGGAGDGEEIKAIPLAGKRRQVIRRVVSYFAATAAAVILVVLAAHILLSPPERTAPPMSMPDSVSVARGYLHRTINIEGVPPMHVIVSADDATGATSVSAGKGYMYAIEETQDGAEIVRIVSEEAPGDEVPAVVPSLSEEIEETP
ncbi:MAG: zf-HC2 domain-containing protein [Planctomycetota bacterium]